MFFFVCVFYGHFSGKLDRKVPVAKMINNVYLCASNLKQLARRNESSQKNQKTWKALRNFNGSCEVVVRLPWFNNCLGKSLFMLFDDISSFT